MHHDKLFGCFMIGFSLQAAFFPTTAPAEAKKNPLFQVETNNTVSPYTEKLIGLLSNWPKAKEFCKAAKEPNKIHTIGVRTADRPYYVGFKKCMLSKAPLAKMESVIDDVDNYLNLFGGFKTVNILSKADEVTVIEWEKEIPFFLAANIKYQISYFADKSESNRKIFRYQFKKGDRLKFNDGLEVIEKQADGSTLFTNYEFYEADYGIGLFGINAVSAETVWKESLEGSFRSLFSIRFKAEHPDWSYEKIHQEREALLKKVDLSAIEYLDSFE